MAGQMLLNATAAEGSLRHELFGQGLRRRSLGATDSPHSL